MPRPRKHRTPSSCQKLIRRYLETSVVNREPRKLQIVLTAEQFLELCPKRESTFYIHPYQARPPWKPLRTTSYRHKSLITPSSILVMLRNRAPFSFGRGPYWPLSSIARHETDPYDDREPFSVAIRSIPCSAISFSDTLAVRDNKELIAPILVEAHPIGYITSQCKVTRPKRVVH